MRAVHKQLTPDGRHLSNPLPFSGVSRQSIIKGEAL